jgi:hypothetical protein
VLDLTVGELGDSVRQVVLKPARRVALESGDDHLVELSRLPDFRDGNNRIRIADSARHVEPGVAETLDARLELRTRHLATLRAVGPAMGGRHK